MSNNFDVWRKELLQIGDIVQDGDKVDVSGFLQVGKGFFLGVTLAGCADFRALGHKPVGV